MDGGETVGNSLGRAPMYTEADLLARVFRTNSINAIVPKNCAPKTFQVGLQTLGDGTCIALLAGSDTKNALLLARVFQDKFHQYDCSEKLCAQGSGPAKVSKP